MAYPSDDVKYITKYHDLKRKVKEIELDNDRLHLKVLKTKKNIQRLHLERAILYERLSGMPPPASAVAYGDPHQPSSYTSFSPQLAPPPPPPPLPPQLVHRDCPSSRPTSPQAHAHAHTYPHPTRHLHDPDSDPYQRYHDSQPPISTAQIDGPSSSMPPPPISEDYRPSSASRFPSSSRLPHSSSAASSYYREHERQRGKDRERTRERDRDRDGERDGERDGDLGGPGLPPMRIHPHSHPHMEASPTLRHHQPPPPPASPPYRPSNGYIPTHPAPYSPDERTWEYDRARLHERERERERDKQRERDHENDYREHTRPDQYNNGYSLSHLPSHPSSYQRYDQDSQRHDQRYDTHPVHSHSHSHSPPTEYANTRSYDSHSRRSSSSTNYVRDHPPAPHTSARRPVVNYDYEFDGRRQIQARTSQQRGKEKDRDPPTTSVPRVREGQVME